MGSFSIWHWLVLIIYFVIFGVPTWRILTRTGHSGWWSFLLLVPLVNIIAFWIFSYKRWPNVK